MFLERGSSGSSLLVGLVVQKRERTRAREDGRRGKFKEGQVVLLAREGEASHSPRPRSDAAGVCVRLVARLMEKSFPTCKAVVRHSIFYSGLARERERVRLWTLGVFSSEGVKSF